MWIRVKTLIKGQKSGSFDHVNGDQYDVVITNYKNTVDKKIVCVSDLSISDHNFFDSTQVTSFQLECSRASARS